MLSRRKANQKVKKPKKSTITKGPKKIRYLKRKLVLMQVCLKSQHQNEKKWYLDSGCSRHMIGNKSWFKNLRPKDSGVVKFANGIKSKIIGIVKASKHDFDLINDVMLVEGLTHNLLSISQFCD